MSRDFENEYERRTTRPSLPVTQGGPVIAPDGVPDDREWESVTGQLLINGHQGT